MLLTAIKISVNLKLDYEKLFTTMEVREMDRETRRCFTLQTFLHPKHNVVLSKELTHKTLNKKRLL